MAQNKAHGNFLKVFLLNRVPHFAPRTAAHNSHCTSVASHTYLPKQPSAQFSYKLLRPSRLLLCKLLNYIQVVSCRQVKTHRTQLLPDGLRAYFLSRYLQKKAITPRRAKKIRPPSTGSYFNIMCSYGLRFFLVLLRIFTQPISTLC